MFDRLEILSLARGLSAYSGARQSVLAENVANANTPGYRARDLVDFNEAYRASDMQTSMKATRAGHLLGDAEAGPGGTMVYDQVQGDLTGNTVSVERELLRAAEIRSDHNRALSVYSASLDILRAAAGRAR